MSLIPPFAEAVKKPRVAYQGIDGSFSDGACRQFFGDEVDHVGMPHFQHVVEAVNSGEFDYGVIPIENSSTGSINDVYDLILPPPCFIVGEVKVEITQNLLAVPGTKLEDIQFAYSHPQGLGQSSKFLQRHNIEPRPFNDTATAARYVAEERPAHGAAIASKQAADYYGLEVVVPHINFNYSNITRFVVIRNQPEKTEAQNKMSMVFKTAHRPGALYYALGHLAYYKLDMARLESRPVVGKPWEYAFYVDVLGSWDNPDVVACLDAVARDTEEFRLLGVYEAAGETLIF